MPPRGYQKAKQSLDLEKLLDGSEIMSVENFPELHKLTANKLHFHNPSDTQVVIQQDPAPLGGSHFHLNLLQDATHQKTQVINESSQDESKASSDGSQSIEVTAHGVEQKLFELVSQLEELKLAKQEMQQVLKTNKITIVSELDKSLVSQRSDSEMQDQHQEYLNQLIMRPLVDFKKIVLKSEGDSLASCELKYKQAKQKETALESLNDTNLDKIIYGKRHQSFKKFKQ